MQKQLLQLWEEAPLAASIAESIERFGEAMLTTRRGEPSCAYDGFRYITASVIR